MRTLRAWLMRFAGMFAKRRREREFAEELENHLQLHIEDNLRAGMRREEARRQALIKLDGLEQTKEKYRERRGLPFLDTLPQDLRYGLRQLRHNPGFTAVAVLTLALGIGANTAMFSIVDGAFLKPLPISNPNEFVTIFTRDSRAEFSEVSYPDFQDLQAESTSLSGAVAYSRNTKFVNSMEESSIAAVDIVSLNYFEVLGVKPLLGRAFSSALKGSEASEPNVVISYALWKNRLGGDPAIVGKTIKLSDQPVTVLGVGPPRFRGLAKFVPTDIWLPVDAFDAASMKPRDWRGFEVAGRMKPGVTPEQIRAELDTIGRRLAQAYPATNKTITFVGETQTERNRGFNLVSLFLMSLVGLVLLIACANVAGLLLARAEVRSREIAIRLAVGARRRRLIRQLLTEGLLLSLAGGAIGLLLAARLIALEPSLLPPAPIQIGPDLQIDSRVLAVTLAVLLLATFIFGLAPAFRATRGDLTTRLKGEEGAAGQGTNRITGRNLVVIGQVALSVLMLSVAGLFLRSFLETLRMPLGFNPHKNLLVVPVGLQMKDSDKQRSLLLGALDKVRGLPGVVRATCAMRLPLSGNGGGAEMRVSIPGVELPEGQETVGVRFNAVGPEYFRTVDTRILKGRTFTSADNADAPRVALVSQTMAARFWPNQDPIGRILRIEKKDYAIIGVVEDVKIIHLNEPPQPYMYIPFAQTTHRGELIIETLGSPRLWIPAVKQEIRGLDSSAVVAWIETGESTFRSEESVYTQRVAAGMVGSLSLLGMFLASVGLYGVVAFVVNRRSREIGIRVALGARRAQILSLVMRQGLNLILIGVGCGLALAVAATRFLAGMIYGVSVMDPVSLLGGALLAIVITLAACYLPALRATKVDPMVALRYE